MTQVSQSDRERAKWLKAVILSSLSGHSPKTEYKRLGDKPLNPFWYEFMWRLTKAYVDQVDNGIEEIMKSEKAGMIQ